MWWESSIDTQVKHSTSKAMISKARVEAANPALIADDGRIISQNDSRSLEVPVGNLNPDNPQSFDLVFEELVHGHNSIIYMSIISRVSSKMSWYCRMSNSPALTLHTPRGFAVLRRIFQPINYCQYRIVILKMRMSYSWNRTYCSVNEWMKSFTPRGVTVHIAFIGS
jgi:hypothetical protein